MNKSSKRQVLAIIPARGGSKGIPHKNLLSLAGRPLLGYTIEHAQKSHSVSRVVVSTDCREIGAFVTSNGAEVIWRPAEISGDCASSESALVHVIQELEQVEGYVPDLIVFLQATSPLRRAHHIDEAISQLDREGTDSLFSAFYNKGFLWRETDQGPVPLNYDLRKRPRRQEASEPLVENGSIYLMKPWVITQLGCRLGGRISVYRMPPIDSLELDDPDDVPLIECLLEMRAGQREAACARDPHHDRS